MLRVVTLNSVWIIKDFGCFSEADAVLLKIADGLVIIPLEFHC